MDKVVIPGAGKVGGGERGYRRMDGNGNSTIEVIDKEK